METLEASKLLNQSMVASSYANKLKILIQQSFRTKKISRYEYEQMINVLTCSILHTDDIKQKLEKYIIQESRKQLRIDVRV